MIYDNVGHKKCRHSGEMAAFNFHPSPGLDQLRSFRSQSRMEQTAIRLEAKLTTCESCETYHAAAEQSQRSRFRRRPSAALLDRDIVQEPVGRIVAEGERQVSLVAGGQRSQGELLPSEGRTKIGEAEGRVSERHIEVVRSSAFRIRQVERQRILVTRSGGDGLRNGRSIADRAKVGGVVPVLGRETAGTSRDITDAGKCCVAGNRPAGKVSGLEASVRYEVVRACVGKNARSQRNEAEC